VTGTVIVNAIPTATRGTATGTTIAKR
jgi:hypothetical protein